MPYKRRYNRRRSYGGKRKRATLTQKKTQARRAEATSRKRAMLPSLTNRIRTGMPESMRFKLKYAEYVTHSSALPSGVVVYRLNSLYDPNQTNITGNQPTGFDEWAKLYSVYKVTGCKMKVVAYSRLTTTGGNVVVVANPSPALPTLTSLSEMMTQPNCMTIFNGPISSGGNPAMGSKYWKMADIFGEDIDDDDYSAFVTTNPVKQAYCELYTSVASETGGLEAGHWVELTYYGFFSNPINLPSS